MKHIFTLFLLFLLIGAVSGASMSFQPSFDVTSHNNIDYMWLTISDNLGSNHHIGFEKSGSGQLAFGKNGEYYGKIFAIPSFKHPVNGFWYICPIRNLDLISYDMTSNSISYTGSDPALSCYRKNDLSTSISVNMSIDNLSITCGSNGRCKVASDITVNTDVVPSDSGFGFFFKPSNPSKYRYVKILSEHIDLLGSDQNLNDSLDYTIDFEDENQNKIGNSWDWNDMICPDCKKYFEILEVGGSKGLLSGVYGLGMSKTISIDPLFIFVGDGNITFEGEPDYFHGYRMGEINMTVVNNLDIPFDISYEDIYLNFPFDVEQSIYYMKTEVKNITEGEIFYYYNFTSLQRFDENITLDPLEETLFNIRYTIPSDQVGKTIKFDLNFMSAVLDPYFISNNSNWTDGTFYNISINASSGYLEINESESNFSGSYYSDLYDAGGLANWTNISWDGIVNQGCYGTADDCSTLDGISCSLQVGCNWSGFPDFLCSGTPNACNTFTDYDNCSPRNDSTTGGTSQYGCFWGNQSLIFNVRSCDDSLCIGESFGSDNYTNGSVIHNLTVSNNQWFQYKADFWTWNITEGSPQLIESRVGFEIETTTSTSTTSTSTTSTSTIPVGSGNATCIKVHSAGDSFYSIGACYVDGNASEIGLNYTCNYYGANEYFCIPHNRDAMIKILPYDFDVTNSTGNYAYNILTNFTLLVVVGSMAIVMLLIMALLWILTTFIRV